MLADLADKFSIDYELYFANGLIRIMILYQRFWFAKKME